MRIAVGLFALAMLAAAPAVAQDTSAAPNYGTLNLSYGFSPDPRVVTVVSGGVVDASGINSSCAGYISRAPDVRLNYDAGSLPLIISAASSDDTTLVVNAPNGSWYCDDDGGVNGLNPAVFFSNPQSGRYEIWVGSYSAGTNSRASLHISEVSSQ